LRHRDAPKGYEPPLHRLLAIFQKRIASMYNVQVGSEMLAAVDAAKEVGARVALIDMESDLVYYRFMTEMSFEEKIKFFVGILLGFFARKKDIEREVKKFENDLSTYMQMFGKEFPTIKRILIDERNQYMAAIIRELGKTQPRLVVVVGDGHVRGIRDLLKKDYGPRLDIIRLRELKQGTWKKMDLSTDLGSASKISFSFDTE
jgi:pheromone shutdown protein TraB